MSKKQDKINERDKVIELLTRADEPALIGFFNSFLKKADESYYVKDDPIMKDAEYDEMFRKLKYLEEKYSELLDTDSVTQRVSGRPVAGFKKVTHTKPILSLANAFSDEDIVQFDKRVNPNGDLTYVLEPKYDGLAISIVYENNKLVQASTRGDGLVGDDVTDNVKAIKGIPHGILGKKYGVKMLSEDNIIAMLENF